MIENEQDNKNNLVDSKNIFYIASQFYIAGQLHLLGDLQQAKNIFKQILRIQPNNVDTLHGLGILEYELGNKNEALGLIVRAIKLKPNDAFMYNNLGLVLKDSGKLADALSFFQRATELNPDIAEFYFNLASVFHLQKKLSDAVNSYNKSIELCPDNYQAYVNLGVLYSIDRNFKQAEINYKKALEYNKPESSEIYSHLAFIQENQGNWFEAEKNYIQAITLNTGNYEAYNNLGTVYFNLGKCSEAEKNYCKAIELKPNYSITFNNLGFFYNSLGKSHEAEKNYCKAIEVDPNNMRVYSNLFLFMLYQGNFTQEAWQKELDLFSNSKHVTEMRAIASLHKYESQSAKSAYIINKKLRLGYVSADFFNSSSFCFIEPLLKNHNRDAFEIICYAEVENPDKYTLKIQEHVDSWHSTIGMSDTEMADLIKKDKIDILIDLMGHTLVNRLAVFAAKPAPIQITWLSFPASTGLKEIDYRLSDKYLTPDGTSEYFAEKIWNLKRLSYCFNLRQDTPEIEILPCLNNGYITFCSFANLNKITETTISLWSGVLINIPDSRIILNTKYIIWKDIKQRFIDMFEKYGIKADRIDFFYSSDDYFAFYNRADISLDTYPLNGGTITMDSLWMGVPVISLAGSRTASRLGLAFLSAAGLAELVVNTPEEFTKVAVELSSNTTYLSALRNGMRLRMINSPIMDYSGFAQAVEEAYMEMWKIL